MDIKSWGVLALLAVVSLLVSGCAGMTEAASDVQKGADGNASVQTENAPALLPQAVAQGNTRLHFDPAPQQVEVGGVAGVQLRLEDVNNLYGIEVHLTFDASLVQIEDDDAARDGVQIAVGDIPYPEFSVQNMVDNMGGRLDYAVVQLGPRPAASGSGVVATIRFRGVSEGTSPIRFTSAKLASPEGSEIAVTLHEGSIVVVSTPSATMPSPTTPPPSTPPPATPPPTANPTLAPGPAPTLAPGPAPTLAPGPAPTLAPGPAPTLAPGPAPTLAPVAPSPATSACPALYVVGTDDTAFSIARRFGVSLDALAAANGLSSSFGIKIGQLLVLPGVPGPTAAAHVVQAGDTLYSIARRYGANVETVAALNRIPHPWHVRLGQTLLFCPQ